MNVNYFMDARPNILKNEKLREPQIDAYVELYNHFITNNKQEDAIVVLPTGVGKTGLMAIAPFLISKGRVLIIAPQLTILDTLESSLSPNNASNFWSSMGIIANSSQLPQFVVFEGGDSRKLVLDEANIVLANIQKLQKKNDASLINKYPSDYFDMIIIDEAHHSAAQTWIDTINHFTDAKVIKITATPYRTDKQDLVGELVYKYKLSQAMNKGYVKSLEKFNYIPEQLYLNIPDDENKYTVDEILKMEKYDESWIARSVSFSDECKEKVIVQSLDILTQKRNGTSVPHKIIAAAPNVNEAIKIAQMYSGYDGVRAVAVHNELDPAEREKIFSDIENNRVDVVVNVNMMGEGYDHKYLSVAAIFRVFRNILPYEQFIGRILRSIPENEVKKPTDQIGSVVVHENLNLDKLWLYYREQIQEWEFIKEIEELDVPERGTSNPVDNVIEYDFGTASEDGEGTLSHDVYMDTTYLQEKKIYEKNRQDKIDKMMEILPTMGEKEAGLIIDGQESSDTLMNRPDLLVKYRKQTTDKNIKEQIVPELLAKYDYTFKGTELSKLPIFSNNQYSWILKRVDTNAAILAIYFSQYLKKQIGTGREHWGNEDFERASKLLENQARYIDQMIGGMTS